MTTRETTRQARLDAIDPSANIYKQFDIEMRAAEGDRRVKFTVTTRKPDRDHDVLETGGIETAAYEKNPVVQWAHDYKMPPIGRCVFLERFADRLVATVEFATADLNPFADQIYRMVKASFIKACSIGFRPLEWRWNETRGGVDFYRAEMLEFSVCPIGANAEALVALSAAGIDTAVLKDWAHGVLRSLGHPVVPQVVQGHPDDVVLLLADNEPESSDLVTFDPHDLKAAVATTLRNTLTPLVATELRAVLNAARGRID